MDELLKALQTNDHRLVGELAYRLFVINNGRVNPLEIQVFERYAPCRIYPISASNGVWSVGAIVYYGRIFRFNCTEGDTQ